MIQKKTRLRVADNSGARIAECIHVVGSTGRRYAYPGDIVKCAVKKAIPGGKVKKGDVVTGVVVRAVKECRRIDGSYVSFDDNAIVLVLDDSTPVGSRIIGPIARELRANPLFEKIVSLAEEVW